MHPAEVIAVAHETSGNVPKQVPEERYLEPAAKPGGSDALTLGVLATGIAGLLFWEVAAATGCERP